MPLTAFQREVALVLARHCHVAGGAVINRAEQSYRFSTDLDIFHDLAASVSASAELDVSSLQTEGYEVEWTLRQEGFFRAEVSRGDDRLRLDWSTDSAAIFEVLSRKTRQIDEGEKKEAYLTIRSLGAYLLIEQEEPAVVVLRRKGRRFEREVYEGLDAVIPLPEIEIELPLSEIYEGVRFAPEPEEES